MRLSCFKPTYKEWKLLLVIHRQLLPTPRFKPTYKEWKLRTPHTSDFKTRIVLSLPTRNGNNAVRNAATSASVSVLSLPTRNGNCSAPAPQANACPRFKPTYKEWKLGHPQPVFRQKD